MRIIFTLLLLLFISSISAQIGYEVSKDAKNSEVKVLRGSINKYLLQEDEQFKKWYESNQKGYLPDSAVLNALANEKNNIQFILFGGTWCDDTQYILPKFFKIQEMSAVPDDAITFFGVNRQKQALDNIASAFTITNVPTIIVMKNGKEIGRVVEYGKTGKWEKELTDIIRGL